jgi:hypothetical protein
LKLALAPESSTPEPKPPASAVTVWGTPSWLVQVTVVPAATARFAGLKAKFAMLTAAVADAITCPAGAAAGAAASGAAPPRDAQASNSNVLAKRTETELISSSGSSAVPCV